MTLVEMKYYVDCCESIKKELQDIRKVGKILQEMEMQLEKSTAVGNSLTTQMKVYNKSGKDYVELNMEMFEELRSRLNWVHSCSVLFEKLGKKAKDIEDTLDGVTNPPEVQRPTDCSTSSDI